MIRLQQLAKIMPQLSYENTKGGNGIVGVIGGSIEYTGAPYYAAMAALKTGADLVHIFCAKQASTAIKTYSPQLIVHPVFDYNNQNANQIDSKQVQQMIDKWVLYFQGRFTKIKTWVIGPGLGRTKIMSVFFRKFIEVLPENTNIVIDADGLFFLCQNKQLIQKLGKLKCILTPNHTQFKHLNKFLKISEETVKISKKLPQIQQKNDKNLVAYQQKSDIKNQICIILKGEMDIIFHQNNTKASIILEGSKKRCGGIGDILAGCVAVCSFWDFQLGLVLGCVITKKAAKKAFQKHGRSLTAVGVLDQLQSVINQIQNK